MVFIDLPGIHTDLLTHVHQRFTLIRLSPWYNEVIRSTLYSFC